MTSYFDRTHEAIRLVSRAFSAELDNGWHRLEEIERRIVRDVSICSQISGFPIDLYDRVHGAIVKYAVECRPLNAPVVAFQVEDETVEYIKRLHDLTWELHTIFHDLARRKLDEFSDQPDTPLMRLASRAEAYREALIIRQAGPQPTTLPCMDCREEESERRLYEHVDETLHCPGVYAFCEVCARKHGKLSAETALIPYEKRPQLVPCTDARAICAQCGPFYVTDEEHTQALRTGAYVCRTCSGAAVLETPKGIEA